MKILGKYTILSRLGDRGAGKLNQSFRLVNKPLTVALSFKFQNTRPYLLPLKHSPLFEAHILLFFYHVFILLSRHDLISEKQSRWELFFYTGCLVFYECNDPEETRLWSIHQHRRQMLLNGKRQIFKTLNLEKGLFVRRETLVPQGNEIKTRQNIIFRSSKSLLANVLDIDDDFRHNCRPLTPGGKYIINILMNSSSI